MNQKYLQIKELREPVIKGITRPEKWRRVQLKRISKLINEHENEIIQALSADLKKPPTEALFEIIAVKQELKLAQEQLRQWMRPQPIGVPFSLKPGEAWTEPEPLGCVLIIGPWNYPFSLIIQPLVSALAAGNTAVLKPSENAPQTSLLIQRLINHLFPKDVVEVVTGDGGIASELVQRDFDHIFFTGGSVIGKKVMEAASKNLTPITLELGGKSPAIVLKGADLAATARRLIWGKGINAGQTCIAPNHILVEEKLRFSLLNELKNAQISLYGENPIQSPHLAKIINSHHFERLTKLLEDARSKGQIHHGGRFSQAQRQIEPTIIEVDEQSDPLLEEELFGPLLPVLSTQNLNSAIGLIQKQPRPLAIYLFGGSKSDQQHLIEKTSSGSICFNDVVMQAGIPDLPFGGVGASGMGRYHGYAGFKTFSNEKSILKRPFWFDIKLRYPPYNLDPKVLKNLLG